jgi:hypothetical protein
MILAGSPFDNLFIFGYLEPFGDSLSSFNLWHKFWLSRGGISRPSNY